MKTAVTFKNRIFYLDILRTIGCLAVVLAHVSAIFTRENDGSINYYIGILFSLMARFSVPLFVMISGALFLDEAYLLTRAKLLDHIKRLILFFFGWSIIYCLFQQVIRNLLKGRSISLLHIVMRCLIGPIHLWFIPMIIGLYIITPFLRLWIKKENKDVVKQFLLLGFLFNTLFPFVKLLIDCFLTDFSQIFKLIEDIHFTHCTGYVFYFVLGWYLHQFDIVHTRHIWGLGIGGLSITLFGNNILGMQNMRTAYFFDSFSIGILLFTIAIFVYVKSAFQCKDHIPAVAELICRHSMGIYAIHISVFPIFTRILKIQHAALALPVYSIIAVVLSLSVSVVLKRIKVLRFLI